MFVDTHTHLYSDKFSEDIDKVITRALEAGVERLYLPNIDSSSTEAMNRLRTEYPGLCFPMMGLHPCSVKENYKDELDHVIKQLAQDKYYGVGETGVDLYWDTTFKKEQIEAFEIQIGLSKEYNLPIIIHSRESLDLTIDIITKNQDGKLTGIFHCFNGTIEQCKKIQDIGFMMGLGGVVTFKSAKMEEVVKYMDIDHILLETDAPYLAPTPHRGKRNESAYLPLIAQKVADFREIDISEVMRMTTANASKIFCY